MPIFIDPRILNISKSMTDQKQFRLKYLSKHVYMKLVPFINYFKLVIIFLFEHILT